MSKIQFYCFILINLKQNSAYSKNKTTGLTVLANTCIIKHHYSEQDRSKRGLPFCGSVCTDKSRTTRASTRRKGGFIILSICETDTHTNILKKAGLILILCAFY